MKQYTNLNWENILEKLQGCETVAGYLAEKMPVLTIQDLQERLENLRELIQETKDWYIEKVEQ